MPQWFLTSIIIHQMRRRQEVYSDKEAKIAQVRSGKADSEIIKNYEFRKFQHIGQCPAHLVTFYFVVWLQIWTTITLKTGNTSSSTLSQFSTISPLPLMKRNIVTRY